MRNYQDDYFEKGHWWLKIVQTVVMLLAWLAFFVPIIITGATYWAYRSHGRHGYDFWHYAEGFAELDFLMVFLTFAAGMIAVFCLAMSFIQWRRSKGLVNTWPMFNIIQNQQKSQRAEDFMQARFGSQAFRQRQRFYTVQPDQNLTKNQLKAIVNGRDQGGDSHGV
ncbi:ABC transporter permease [Limosilactobacillus difficilis]|uniref:ABC transporter permease n=1 Tax=Limosilactobacillus difficilis TaxID=2991838 RepID=UPI0024B8CC4B|nr:ABC transporter permease [Limosilactobacillus difficilis]